MSIDNSQGFRFNLYRVVVVVQASFCELVARAFGIAARVYFTNEGGVLTKGSRFVRFPVVAQQ